MRGSALVKAAVAAAAGAAAAHLFDPDRGRSRRARLRDQARAFARREARAVQRRASFQRGRLEGVAQRLRHPVPTAPGDDRALADRVRSEALGRQADHPHPTIDVVNGVVTVRGEVADPATAADVTRRIRAVPGVVGVENLLHRPGDPAPNKADALRTDTQ